MMKTRFFLVMALFAALTLGGNVSAQVAHGGAPMFNHAKSTVPVSQIDRVDNQALLQEDMDMVPGSSPLRMGKLQETSYSNLVDGVKTTLADGTLVWRFAINSPSAYFMNVGFSTFDIPEGAELYLYDETGDFILGSFTNQNRKADGGFYTQSIPGDVVYLEYREPADVAGQGRLVISDVVHGYKDMFGDVLGVKGPIGDAEGDCHINVKCNTADPWKDQVRSVVCLQILSGQYVYACSGALINNTNLDRTPYVLTAYHCQDLDGTLDRWITYFNYQTTQCQNNSGPCNKTVTGATIKAKYSFSGGSDFCLLLLDENVPDSYKPYYAGWERSNLVNESAGSCIHHPGGDFKKISIPKTVKRMTGSYQNFYEVHWYTGTENKGVTEQGSSGSPLFNADKRIIGQLYAGTSACNYMQGSDMYGRLYISWNGQNTATSRLSNWLDPTGSDVQYLDGLDYQDPVGIDAPERQAAALSVFPNPSNGMVHINIDAIGTAYYSIFDLSGRCVRQGSTVLTATDQVVNLTSLPLGSYTLQVSVDGRNYSAQIIIK